MMDRTGHPDRVQALSKDHGITDRSRPLIIIHSKNELTFDTE